MEFELDPDIQMLLSGSDSPATPATSPTAFEEEKILTNLLDYYEERGLDVVVTPESLPLLSNSIVANNWSYDSSTASSPSIAATPASISTPPSSVCSSAHSPGQQFVYPPNMDYNPPSTSSSTTSSSSGESSYRVTTTPSKRAIQTRRVRNITSSSFDQVPSPSASSSSSPSSTTRGRGRPSKADTDGNATIIRKRQYAREYRKKVSFTFSLPPKNS